MSTLVCNEDEFVVQWIEYHHSLGFQKFIIYDNINKPPKLVMDEMALLHNEKKSLTSEKIYSLGLKLKKYIENDIVFLIDWHFPLTLFGRRSGQTTQINHCIYAFNDVKYIGFFDVDEYLNPQISNFSNIFRVRERFNLHLNQLGKRAIYDNLKIRIASFLTSSSENVVKIKKNNSRFGVNIDIILDKVIQIYSINPKNIGSFKVLSKMFYNPKNKSTRGYDFLKIAECEKQARKYGYQKNIVIPRNVNSLSVHDITSGKPSFTIPPMLLFFNHYFYLNKKDRGKEVTNYSDNSISRNLNNLESLKNIT